MRRPTSVCHSLLHCDSVWHGPDDDMFWMLHVSAVSLAVQLLCNLL